MTTAIQDEVEHNYQSFRTHLPQLLATHRGKFALMRQSVIVEFFDTARDAYLAGRKLFATDQLFSIRNHSGGNVLVVSMTYRLKSSKIWLF
jgi:hypothetical protein